MFSFGGASQNAVYEGCKMQDQRGNSECWILHDILLALSAERIKMTLSTHLRNPLFFLGQKKYDLNIYKKWGSLQLIGVYDLLRYGMGPHSKLWVMGI
jgi:hypothetical protein